MIFLGLMVFLFTFEGNFAYPNSVLNKYLDSADVSPRVIFQRRSAAAPSKPIVYQNAPNLDYEWLTHIKKAPEIMSFHDKIGSPTVISAFKELVEFFERALLCPLFVQLEKLDSDPGKNHTTVLFTEKDAKGIKIVLTDNKTYFVGVATEDGIVTIDKFVKTLDPAEEEKIKEKLKEIGFNYTPSSVVRKDQCLY